VGELKDKSVCGNIGKVLPIQLPIGEDLVASLKRACRDKGIRYAAILSTVGSLRQLTIENVIASKTSKTGADFGPPKVFRGPLQVMSLEGFIYDSAKGEMDYHIHGLFADTDGKICGGHLIEGGNPVQTRLVIVVGEIAGVRMAERLDEASGHLIMNVEPL
jgi:predicted DNA-binding protein with PD1-like motif